MKAIPFLFFLILLTHSTSVYSQCCPYMEGIEIIPQSPTPDDSITFITSITTPGLGFHLDSLLSEIFHIDGQTIHLYSCHYSGPTGALDHFKDTFQIGKLATGNYTVIHHASQTGSPDSCYLPVQNFDTLQINVSDITPIHVVSTTNITLFPKIITEYQNVHVRANDTVNELILIDQFGRLVKKEKICSRNFSFTTHNLNRGLHIVHLHVDNTWKAHKILIL